MTKPGEPRRHFDEIVVHYCMDECLTWPFGKSKAGYGMIWIDGRLQYVHRLVCKAINGPPPTPKHQAAHSCGNGHKGCVNRRHVAWKTPKENQADRVRHGTSGRGENNNMAKLTEGDVRQIFSLRGKVPTQEIAERFNIHPNHVSRILRGGDWAWLTQGETSQ